MVCGLKLALPGRAGQRLRLCVLEVCRTLLSHEPFSVFPDDHSGALMGLLKLSLFQGESGLYIDEWTGLSLLSSFLQFLL